MQDLFPQSVIDLGLLKDPLLVEFFAIMERRVYRGADLIMVMSDGNRDYVSAKVGPSKQVVTVPNWADADEIRPGERMNGFREAHALGNQFIVLFAGTMGWSQGLDVAIEAARELAAEPNLLFLIVGDGVEKEKLELQAAGLPNVRFLPIQPKEVYPQVLAAADACLVTLRREVRTPTVPSKINTIMAAGRPILASIPLHGDAPRLIQAAEAGITAPRRRFTRPGRRRLVADAQPGDGGENGKQRPSLCRNIHRAIDRHCANSSLASPGSECEEAPRCISGWQNSTTPREWPTCITRAPKSSRGLSWRGSD